MRQKRNRALLASVLPAVGVVLIAESSVGQTGSTPVLLLKQPKGLMGLQFP